MKGDINVAFEDIRDIICSIIEEYFYYVFVICGIIISYFALKLNKLNVERSYLILDLNEARKNPPAHARSGRTHFGNPKQRHHAFDGLFAISFDFSFVRRLTRVNFAL